MFTELSVNHTNAQEIECNYIRNIILTVTRIRTIVALLLLYFKTNCMIKKKWNVFISIATLHNFKIYTYIKVCVSQFKNPININLILFVYTLRDIQKYNIILEVFHNIR